MTDTVILVLVASLVVVSLCTAAGAADEEGSFLRDGDVWAFTGDSITNNDTYRRTIERVFRHFHPDAKVRFVPGGVSGSLATAAPEQFAKASEKDTPEIVSLMTGMNNSINAGWRFGQPVAPPVESYRQSIEKFVRAAKGNGVQVLLMSPTLTDESLGWGSMWELRGTQDFLRQCWAACRQVADAEGKGVSYIPVGEEFEQLQATFPPERIFCYDGVHPAALGQYQIARILLRRLRLGDKLAGTRAITPPPPPLGVSAELKSTVLHNGDANLVVVLKSDQPRTLKASWDIGEHRGQADVTLPGEGKAVELNVTIPALKLELGKADDLVLDLRDAKTGATGVWIVDLCRTAVLHLTDGSAAGKIVAAADRPEGKTVADWSLKVHPDGGMMIEVVVFDSDLQCQHDWPWGRDGVRVLLDYRPADRFGQINWDADVLHFMLLPTTQPRFGIQLRPWCGRGVEAVAVSGGEKTPKGYRVWVLLPNLKSRFAHFDKWHDADLRKRDRIGLNLIVTDQDAAPNGRTTIQWHNLQETQLPHDTYANNMPVVDLKNQLPADSVIHAEINQLLP